MHFLDQLQYWQLMLENVQTNKINSGHFMIICIKHQPDETDTSMYTVDNLVANCWKSRDGSVTISIMSYHQIKYNNLVTKDMSEGQAAGVSGTPTTFINGVAIVGAVPYSQIKAAIDNDLQ